MENPPEKLADPGVGSGVGGPEVLCIGHVVVLKNEANNSFIAADARRTPQVRCLVCAELRTPRGRVHVFSWLCLMDVSLISSANAGQTRHRLVDVSP